MQRGRSISSVNQTSTYSNSDYLNRILTDICKQLELDNDDYLKVKSFLLYALNRVDEPSDVVTLFPMLYVFHECRCGTHLTEHPTYKFIVRRFIVR